MGEHLPKSFEVIHSQCITSDPRTTDEFCKDIQGDFDSGDGFDYADGNDENEAQEDTIEHDTNGSVRLPPGNASTSKTNSKAKSYQIPPLRNYDCVCQLRLTKNNEMLNPVLTFRIFSHQLVMNICIVMIAVPVLLLAEAVEQIAKAHGDLTSVIKPGV